MVFSLLDNSVRKYVGYRERRSDKGFEELEYDNDIIWQNGTAGGCHSADFWSLVAEKVYVHRGDIKFTSGNELSLDDENGTHFPCDTVLCGTGRKHGLVTFNHPTLIELGLPYPKVIELQEETGEMGEARRQVRRGYPRAIHHAQKSAKALP